MEVYLLVGSDHYWELTTGRVSRGEDGPMAVETKLGWVLSGPVLAAEQSMSLITTHTLRVDTHEEARLDDTPRAFWESESLGIAGSDRSVHQDFEDHISFKDGRYEVSLPWKHPHPILPDNFKLSQKRLQSVLRRLRQTRLLRSNWSLVLSNQFRTHTLEKWVTCITSHTMLWSDETRKRRRSGSYMMRLQNQPDHPSMNVPNWSKRFWTSF